MFNISPALLAGLGQNAQNLINQLIASGGINQANSTAIQALLAQLANQSNSILSQPFATFGGGLTLFGLTTGGTGVTINLNLNDSNLRSLEHVTLRAGQNNAATLKIGERYPLVNATFSPIYNTPAIAQVIGNSSYIAPFPSFYFEDLGLVLKATPLIHGERDITLKLELAIRSLGTQTVNGMPIINNREYKGTITVKDGESSVVTGLLTRADALSLTGYPFLSRVPGFTYAASEHDKNGMDDEVLVVITPHVVRVPERSSFAVIVTQQAMKCRATCRSFALDAGRDVPFSSTSRARSITPSSITFQNEQIVATDFHDDFSLLRHRFRMTATRSGWFCRDMSRPS